MKQSIKFILLAFTTLSVQVSKAAQYEPEVKQTALYVYLQDTAFFHNYIAATKEVYLYSNPDLTSKTKTKLPQDVALSVTKKSGDFVYGKFSISSNKSFKGWFLLSDLKEILFTAPKIN